MRYTIGRAVALRPHLRRAQPALRTVARTVARLAHTVTPPPLVAALVAPARLPPRPRAGCRSAPVRAVDVAPVARPADHHLGMATPAAIEPVSVRNRRIPPPEAGRMARHRADCEWVSQTNRRGAQGGLRTVVLQASDPFPGAERRFYTDAQRASAPPIPPRIRSRGFRATACALSGIKFGEAAERGENAGIRRDSTAVDTGVR